MTTIFGMINILLTEINKLKELLHYINVNLRLILATLKPINLKRKAQLISVFISLEVHVLKVLIADFITEFLKKKTWKQQMKII